MTLGESEVSLQEAIPEQTQAERVFFPTFAEWVADGNAEQIIEQGSQVGNGTNRFYTVPASVSLFITSLWLSAHTTAATASANLNTGSSTILKTKISANFTAFLSQNFNSPLKLNPGDYIQVVSQALGQSDAGFAGFLLPKKISIR